MLFKPVQPLNPGSKVAVIAPASAFDRAAFEVGLKVIAERYVPEFREGLFASTRYLAGDDERRLQELTSSFSYPATFCARGGYGVMRLLASLSTSQVRSNILVGFSDITALHLFYAKAGFKSVHGPVLTQLGKQNPEVIERLFWLLEKSEVAPPLFGTGGLGTSSVQGPLLGGNLSVMTRLLGTPFFPDLSGAVLLIEDVGERPYRLDRMLTHLKLAGALERVAGFALGEFTECVEKDADYTALEVVLEILSATKKPIVYGLPIGHGAVNQPVVHGGVVRIDPPAHQLNFVEPLVS